MAIYSYLTVCDHRQVSQTSRQQSKLKTQEVVREREHRKHKRSSKSCLNYQYFCSPFSRNTQFNHNATSVLKKKNKNW